MTKKKDPHKTVVLYAVTEPFCSSDIVEVGDLHKITPMMDFN